MLLQILKISRIYELDGVKVIAKVKVNGKMKNLVIGS